MSPNPFPSSLDDAGVQELLPAGRSCFALEVLLLSGTAFDVHQLESWCLRADAGSSL